MLMCVGESLMNTTALASLKLWERQLSRVWLVVVSESRCMVAIWPIYAPGFHDMHFVQVPTHLPTSHVAWLQYGLYMLRVFMTCTLYRCLRR